MMIWLIVLLFEIKFTNQKIILSMNKFLKSLMAIALAAFVFVGCQEDCNNDCNLRGEADPDNNCVCDCDEGFEGDNCDDIPRDKFIAQWNASDNCLESGSFNYSSTINPFNGVEEQVQIVNLAGVDSLLAWTARVSGDSIIIPLSASDFFEIEGLGIISLDRTTINWTYKITDSLGQTDDCTGEWTKQ